MDMNVRLDRTRCDK